MCKYSYVNPAISRKIILKLPKLELIEEAKSIQKNINNFVASASNQNTLRMLLELEQFCRVTYRNKYIKRT